MDDLLDFVLDFFSKLTIWEPLNRYLRKKIPVRSLRWVVAALIYLFLFGILIIVLAAVKALF